MKLFERYKEIIDDWQAFVEASRTPLPTCIWTNPLRVSPETVQTRLQKDGIFCEPVKWRPGAFRLPADFGAGARTEYLAGLYHIQEEVAMLPAIFLAPKPGDLVLDLCAAPGNKTAQMAVMMQNQGTVVANEKNGRRMQPMRQVVNRLGLMNVTATLADATAFPRQSHWFDHVMADVVCSCEGTSRKNPDILESSHNGHSLKIQASQFAILKRALQLCKPGGRVIYATCTYAPEENEMVIQAALDELGAKIPARIVECNLPDFQHSAGLERWQGQQFRADMANAWRIYPHQNDTGGFFFALIEKLDDLRRWPLQKTDGAEAESRMLEVVATGLFEFAEERWGLSRSLFSDYHLFRTNSKIASIVPAEHLRIARPETAFIGMPFIHINMKYPKLTTAAAMYFGAHARRNVLTLTPEQASSFLRGEVFTAVPDQISDYRDEGYVILKFEEMFLGTGIYYERQKDGQVTGQYPKAWRLR